MMDKLPPFDAEGETSVIGSLLIDDTAIVRVSLILAAKDFYRDQNALTYAACLTLYERDEAINQITVASELERKGKLAEVGGATYLAGCVAWVPTSLHAEYYANIVKRTSTMRQLIQAGARIAQLGYENSADVAKVLGQSEELLYALREGSASQGFVHLREVLEGCAMEMTIPKGERQEGARLMTGYRDLDKLLGGLHASDLVLLAARPSVGKTALLLNIAEQAALYRGARVAIFSLEMSKEQLAYRLLASRAGVDLQRLTLGQLGDGDTAKVTDALGRLSELAIYIDDAAGQRMGAMRGKAKQLANQYGIDLIVLDYVGLAHSGHRNENRQQEVGEVARELKALAKELNVPVLAAAQLSRAIEQRPDHRPILSDLRETGQLEQHADVVLFIHREDKFMDADEWHRRHPAENYPKGMAEIIVAKHRNGPTGACKLLFQDTSARFVPLEEQRTDYYWQE